MVILKNLLLNSTVLITTLSVNIINYNNLIRYIQIIYIKNYNLNKIGTNDTNWESRTISIIFNHCSWNDEKKMNWELKLNSLAQCFEIEIAVDNDIICASAIAIML